MSEANAQASMSIGCRRLRLKLNEDGKIGRVDAGLTLFPPEYFL
jgi:hypothetical protein